MRTLKRNQRTIYYANYSGLTAVTNNLGQETGEYEKSYGTATALSVHVLPPTGEAQPDYFGMDIQYERILLIEELPSGFSETTVLWIDQTDTDEAYDYRVRGISTGLNQSLVAVAKVKTP